MQLADVWEKIANNARLTPEELAFLKRSATETQLRNSFVAGNTTPENTLALNLPINVFYSEILSNNKTEFTVDIPPNYNHILMFVTATTDKAATGDYIDMQFNGDTGTNYMEGYAGESNGSAAGFVGESLTSTRIGVTFAAAALSTAGAVGSAFLFIPHYKNSAWKTILKIQGFGDTYTNLLAVASVWKNTAPLKTIRYYPDGGPNILAGSIFTLIGIQ